MTKDIDPDEQNKQLREANGIMEGLDGVLGVIRYDSHRKNGLDSALVRADRLIDLKLKDHIHNPAVRALADEMKERLKQAIYAKALRGKDVTKS